MEPTAYLVVGIVGIGMGVSFFVADPQSPTSRPLSLFWVVAGATFLTNPLLRDSSWVWVYSVNEAVIIVTGFEWGLRVVRAQVGGRQTSEIWTRCGQASAVLYGLLGCTFRELEARHWKVMWTSASLGDPAFYLFAVPFFAAIGLPTVRFAMAFRGQFDAAELGRLLALFAATPFWIAGMIGPLHWKPIGFALGEVIFLVGAIRYHVLQGQRGQLLARFVSPEVARVVRDRGLASALQRHRVELSVVACDLRGFTAFAETGAPEEVMRLLEEYYAAVIDCAARFGGSIKDFAGDGILVLVGAPVALADHARRALGMALEIRDRGEEVLGRWRRLGLELGLGVGVASGFATVGAIGGGERLEYGAFGPVVNLAARLASHARGGQVLAESRITAATEGEAALEFEKLDPAELKGFTRPVAVFAVRGAAATAGQGGTT
jgi:adenylate cyclase